MDLDSDAASAEAPAEKPPRWNIVSVALPLAVIAVGLVMVAGSSGYGALGMALVAMIGLGLAGVIGVIAALVALARNERMAWLTVLGLLGNCAALLPILFLMFND